MTIRHSKQLTQPDGADTSKVRPSDWNDDHVDENGNPPQFSILVDNGSDPPAAVTTLVAPGAVIAGGSATFSFVQRSAVVPISAADLLGIDPADDSTFPVLVESPGAQKLLVPIAAVVEYFAETAGYIVDPATKLGIGFVSNAGTPGAVPILVLTSGVSGGVQQFPGFINAANYPNPLVFTMVQDADSAPGGAIPSRVVGTPLVLMLDHAITGGDGTLTVAVSYYEMTLS